MLFIPTHEIQHVSRFLSTAYVFHSIKTCKQYTENTAETMKEKNIVEIERIRRN